MGYARAINLAASRATGDFLVLLNPDTVVLDGALDRLRAFAMAHPGHGLYGGRTIRPNGEVDPRSCWARPSWWSVTCFGFGLSTAFQGSAIFNPESLGSWQRDSVREVGVITGSLCLVPRDVWIELGGFDPVYFMYGEDSDLAGRAARRGYRPIVTPDATIVHEVGASSSTELGQVSPSDARKSHLRAPQLEGAPQDLGPCDAADWCRLARGPLPGWACGPGSAWMADPLVPTTGLDRRVSAPGSPDRNTRCSCSTTPRRRSTNRLSE